MDMLAPRRGILIPTALVIALILFGLATAQLTQVTFGFQAHGRVAEKNKVVMLARAGVAFGISSLKADDTFAVHDASNPYVETFPDGSSYSVTVTPDPAQPSRLLVEATAERSSGLSASAGRVLVENPTRGSMVALWSGGGAGTDSVFVRNTDGGDWRLLRPPREPNGTGPGARLDAIDATGDHVVGISSIDDTLWYYYRGEWARIGLTGNPLRVSSSSERIYVLQSETPGVPLSQEIRGYYVASDGTIGGGGQSFTATDIAADASCANATIKSVAAAENDEIYAVVEYDYTPIERRDTVVRYDPTNRQWVRHTPTSTDLNHFTELAVAESGDGVVVYAIASPDPPPPTGSQQNLYRYELPDPNQNPPPVDDWTPALTNASEVNADPSGRIYARQRIPSTGEIRLVALGVNSDLPQPVQLPPLNRRWWELQANDTFRQETDGNPLTLPSSFSGGSHGELAPTYSPEAEF